MGESRRPGPAGAAPQPAAPAPGASQIPDIQFEKYTLPNGLQVILHVDRKLPIVHVNQWYHVGSKNEKPGRTGFAHLFEHMMFKGSKNVEPEAHTSIIASVGGQSNAYTTDDETVFWETAPAHYLPLMLWLESDRMATLRIDQANEAAEKIWTAVHTLPLYQLPALVAVKSISSGWCP